MRAEDIPCLCGGMAGMLMMESVDQDSPDARINWYIEQNRQAYYREFFEYLQENGDGFFVF